MHVVERGQGPTLVLLHSSGVGVVQWAMVQARLEDRFRTLAVSMTGYAGTAPGTFEDDIAGVAALLSPEVHVCGHSYGSVVALHAARRVGCASLTLFEPVCFDILRQVQDPVGVEQLTRLEAVPGFWDPATAGSPEWMRGFTEYWNGDGAWQTMSKRRQRQTAGLGPKVFAEVCASWRDETPLAEWAALKPRVAIGEHTTVAARRVAEVLTEASGQVLHRVPEAGHMFPLTHPDAVEALLSSCLS